MVSSRAFLVTDAEGPGLVPIADLFNHRQADTTSRWPVDGGDGDGDFCRLNTQTLVAVVSSRAEKARRFSTRTVPEPRRCSTRTGSRRKTTPKCRRRLRARCACGAAMRGARGPVVAKRPAACFVAARAVSGHALFPLRKTRSPPNGGPLEPPTALLVALWAVTATDEAFAAPARARRRDRGARRLEPRRGRRRRPGARRRARGGLGDDLHGHSLRVFLEILDRRRRMYVDVPEDYREDEGTTPKPAGGRQSPNSGRVRARRRRRARRGDEATARGARGVVADELDDAKRRKTAVVAEAEDPFALFD